MPPPGTHRSGHVSADADGTLPGLAATPPRRTENALKNFSRAGRIGLIAVLVCFVTGCVVLPPGHGRGFRGHHGHHHGFAPQGHATGHWVR
jgi:hypothetical protein